VGEENLPDSTGRELAPPVSHDTNAHDRDVDLVVLDPRDAPDRALRHSPLPEHAVDTCHDLCAVGKWHGARIELFEVANAEVHRTLEQ